MAGLPDRLAPALRAGVSAAAAGCARDRPRPADLDSLPPVMRDSLPRVFAASDFVAQACARDAELLGDLGGEYGLTRPSAPGDYAARAPAAGTAAPRRTCWPRCAAGVGGRWCASPGAPWPAGRRSRRRLPICPTSPTRPSAWRTEHARQALAARYGEPRSAAGAHSRWSWSPWASSAARELNFSSDVDLVLLFPEHGETDGPRADRQRGVLHAPRPGPDPAAGNRHPRWLHAARGHAAAPLRRQRSAGGELRRLRGLPAAAWPRLGALRLRQGAAGYRARATMPRSAPPPLGPFVYRRYLDYGVFESLREMKALIEREVERRELAGHIKLGPGGIREIEFIVQAFQLIRGGRERAADDFAAAGAATARTSCSCCRRGAWRSCARPICSCGGWRTACRCSPTARSTASRRSRSRSERIALAMGAAGLAGAAGASSDRASGVCQPALSTGRVRGAARGGAAVSIDLGRLWDAQAPRRAALADALARAGCSREPRAGGADAAGAARLGAGAQAR